MGNDDMFSITHIHEMQASVVWSTTSPRYDITDSSTDPIVSRRSCDISDRMRLASAQTNMHTIPTVVFIYDQYRRRNEYI